MQSPAVFESHDTRNHSFFGGYACYLCTIASRHNFPPILVDLELIPFPSHHLLCHCHAGCCICCLCHGLGDKWEAGCHTGIVRSSCHPGNHAYTLQKTNMAMDNPPFQWEIHLQTVHFLASYVSLPHKM